MTDVDFPRASLYLALLKDGQMGAVDLINYQ